MKAHVTKTTVDTLSVRGIALDFNCMHEDHIRREGEAEALINEKYPGAMDILNTRIDFSTVKNSLEAAERYEDVTKACCEYFDALFGLGTAKKLLGDKPYCGLAIQVFTEYKAEIMKQGLDFGLKVGQILTRYAPVGPSGEKPKGS